MASRSGADWSTLGDVIAGIATVSDDLTIYAGEEPAGPSTRVVLLDQSAGDPPADVRYLLEVVIAKEVLEVWSEWRDGRQPTLPEACEAVLHYASHDAYLPD
ncbi:hypothetical protein LFM09_32030 [Lentzea alba]|uniref:hypothetical protein n=1 Tax=Lentzea alba TaxID=2714351 RepID=UPI0039BF4F39